MGQTDSRVCWGIPEEDTTGTSNGDSKDGIAKEWHVSYSSNLDTVENLIVTVRRIKGNGFMQIQIAPEPS